MDPLTHFFITRKIVGTDAKIVFAGLFSDLPFYLTYPAWVIRRGVFNKAVKNNDWPEAPKWMLVLHHGFHSLPMVLLASIVSWFLLRTWPRWTIAWGLHILIYQHTHVEIGHHNFFGPFPRLHLMVWLGQHSYSP
jgi:hypothetical protein